MNQSLASLQAERERLKAANARAEFESARDATVSAADVMAAGDVLRCLVMDAVSGLADRMVDAIDGERDETRVHYLLSEAAYLWATALGESAARAATALPEIGDSFRRGIKPRDLITVSEWADRHRELRSGTNAPGPWRTALTPYLREIVFEPFGGSGTTLMAAQRTGRIGRAVEIAPECVDVALLRFQQNFPGVPVTLAATGEPFEVVAQQRKAEHRQESEHATV